jgi:hypothetical protein
MKQLQTYKGVSVLTMKRGEGERIAGRLLVDSVEEKFPSVFQRLGNLILDTRKPARRAVFVCEPGLRRWCQTTESRDLACIVYALTGCNHTVVNADYPHRIHIEDDEYETWALSQEEPA